MRALDLLIHLFNFALPALVVGALVAAAAPFCLKSAARRGFWWQTLANTAAGLVALAGGLWYFGNDGKMASYCAMVLLVASSQWVGAAGWRR